jgi:hypothetical protein
VWKARNPAAIDSFLIDDFVITPAGSKLFPGQSSRNPTGFMAKINDLQFEVIEMFQNQDGRRVASSWRITGKNNGILGATANQQPIFLHRHRGLGGARRWKAPLQLG